MAAKQKFRDFPLMENSGGNGSKQSQKTEQISAGNVWKSMSCKAISWLGPVVGWVAILLGGCASVPPGFQTEPLPQEVTFWKPWLLNSSRFPYPRMVVEVDAVEGTGPPQAWLNDLKRFLESQCDKPGGVQIVRSDSISRKEAAKSTTASLALRYLDGPPAGASFLYLFYYNSAINPSLKPASPHAVVFPYPCAIFVDRNYNMAGFGDILGSLILQHEAGHLTGAARDPTHGDGAHCRNADCLMNPVFQYVPQQVALGGPPTAQTRFCGDCLQDMAESRATPAPSNLRFSGPFLVRQEAGYCVLTLPNTVHLHLGSFASIPFSKMRSAVRQAAAGPMRSREGFILSVSSEGKTPSVLLALEAAGRDPAAPVRQCARLFTLQVQSTGER